MKNITLIIFLFGSSLNAIASDGAAPSFASAEEFCHRCEWLVPDGKLVGVFESQIYIGATFWTSESQTLSVFRYPKQLKMSSGKIGIDVSMVHLFGEDGSVIASVLGAQAKPYTLEVEIFSDDSSHIVGLPIGEAFRIGREHSKIKLKFADAEGDIWLQLAPQTVSDVN